MRNIYLVGMRGSGKTTVGRLLAEKMSRPFRDLDSSIEEKANMSISDYVAEYSWNEFRELERQAVRDVALMSGYIVGTGGGVLQFEGNIKLLNESGDIVFLKASPQTLAEHLQGVADRPSLTGADFISEISTVWQARKTTYKRAAHFIIQTDGLNPEQITNSIISSLGNS